jgi:predicted metallo-beta-lactamase superfamily hydrolase
VPHPIELSRCEEFREKIISYSKLADVVIITHYHYDHHDPENEGIFRKKAMLVKHPVENINKSQAFRSAYFLEKIKELPVSIEYADGRKFTYKDSDVIFSNAVPHGINAKLGYVLEVLIDDGTKFVYSSDVEGPSLPVQADFILKSDPDILYCDGPMTYMLGFRYPQKSLELSINNLIRIIEETRIKKIVLDHHLLRDIRWKERMDALFRYAETSGVKILSAAGFMNVPEDMLEARRGDLYMLNPITWVATA